MALLATLMSDLQFWQRRERENSKHCNPSEKSLPTQYYPSTSACLTPETLKTKLPWTTIAVVFEVLSDCLALLGLLAASAVTFLVELQSDLSLLDKPPAPQPGPHQPKSASCLPARCGHILALQSCRGWPQPAPSMASTFPQPPRRRFPNKWVELSIIFIQVLLW